MNMASRIKDLRIENNMTQEELGNIIGVQKSAIRKYEAGAVKGIKQSAILKMAKKFDVSPAYLMGWTDERHEVEVIPTKEEKELLALYRKLQSSDKRTAKALLSTVDALLGIEKEGNGEGN